MNRRRITLLCAALLLVGGVALAWYVLDGRDSDFHVIGPKTRGVRANLALLDSTVDVADFRDCTNVRAALHRLRGKLHDATLEPEFGKEIDLWFFTWRSRVLVDREAFAKEGTPNILDSAVQFPAESQSMTAKQFLRMTFQQTEAQEVHFIVRGHYIEATTLKRAEEERTRYLDSVSVYDRMRNFWKEITGHVEDDPPLRTEPMFLN